MRVHVILVCATLLGCASANAGPSAASMETVRVSTGQGTMTTTTHPTVNANGGAVAFSLDRTWSVMRSVYDSLEIPVTVLDPAGHTVGNSDLRLRRRLGNVGLSKYIDCGNAQGAPSAETYEIRMSVLTHAQSNASASTEVLTTVQAQGRPITMSAEYTLCTSTGVLERQIVDLVKARLR